MKKTLRVLLFLFFIVMIFTGTASAYETQTKSVMFSINGAPAKKIETAAQNVGEFLKEQGIELGEKDHIKPVPANSIYNNLRIYYERFFEITLIVDGSPIRTYVSEKTVGEVISDYSKLTGITYECITPGLENLQVFENTILEINSKTTKDFETTTPIPFETKTVENDKVDLGVEKTTVAGVNGEKKSVVRVYYVGGKEVSREVISEEVITEPVDEVIEIGTYVAPEPVPMGQPSSPLIAPPENYKEKLTMSATAYTANYECTGKSPGQKGFGITASGMQAQYGVVAVDPRVIPLGTRLYIEGYGEAIAGDTGGAIKGNKIDLYLNTYGECLEFGRRNVTVYVIG